MFDWLVAVLFHKLCTCYLFTQPDHMHILFKKLLEGIFLVMHADDQALDV